MPQRFEEQVRSSLARLEERPDTESLMAGLVERKSRVRRRRVGGSVAAFVVALGLAAGGLALLNAAFGGDPAGKPAAPDTLELEPAKPPLVDPDPRAIDIYERFGDIAFQSNRTGSYELYRFSAEGLEQLTHGPGDPTGPVWSPDSEYIAFSKWSNGRTNLWLLNVSDGSTTRLTNLRADEGDPQWTPDSRWILFSSNGLNNGGINAVSLETGEIASLIPQTLEYSIFEPGLSSDGGTLYYTYAHLDESRDIYSVSIRQAPGSPPASSGEPQLVLGGDQDQDQAAPSPNGDLLAYVSGDHIRVLDLETGRDWQVTTGPGSQSNPSWSPDQRQIFFTNTRYPDLDVYVANVDGSGVENLTGDPGDGAQPAVRP